MELIRGRAPASPILVSPRRVRRHDGSSAREAPCRARGPLPFPSPTPGAKGGGGQRCLAGRPKLGQRSWKPQLVHCDGGRRASCSQRGMSGWREGGRVSPRSCRGGTASCGLLAWLPARPARSPSSPALRPRLPPSPFPALRLPAGRGRGEERVKVTLETERWRENLGNE